jgi:hypothetical protein
VQKRERCRHLVIDSLDPVADIRVHAARFRNRTLVQLPSAIFRAPLSANVRVQCAKANDCIKANIAFLLKQGVQEPFWIRNGITELSGRRWITEARRVASR